MHRYLSVSAAIYLFSTLFSSAAGQPNILLIIADDMKPITGAYGDPLAVTPNMDALSEEGVTFTNTSCTYPVCGGSRASMTTSLMPEETDVIGFEMIRAVLPDVVLLPEHFKNNGYITSCVGKVHDHRTVGDGTPAEEDPNSWSTSPDVIAYDYGGGLAGPTQIEDRDGRRWPLASESKDVEDRKFSDAVRANLGVERINYLAQEYKDNGTPFFLAVGFARPHLPFLVPPVDWDIYNNQDFKAVLGYPQHMHENATNYIRDNVHEMEQSYALNVDDEGYCVPFPWGGYGEPLPDPLSLQNQLDLLQGYYASITHVDRHMGRLLEALELNGIENDTIVIFLGDHGFHLGDHNKWGKHMPLEEAVRSPLIIKAPGVGLQGIKVSSPTNFLDLYPTLCDLAGLAQPTHPVPAGLEGNYGGLTELPLRGKSLVPLMSDPSKQLRFGSISLYRRSPFDYTYRTNRYRYIEVIKTDGSGQVIDRELFDHYTDPHEARNIAPDPGNELIMYRLAVKMRKESETPGAHVLHGSTPVALDPAIYNADEDGDGLSNGHEVDVTDTDPFSPDTDSDGTPDNTDADPLDPSVGATPANADTFIQWKNNHVSSSDDDLSDIDGDGQPLVLEYMLDRNPASASDHATLSGKLDGSQKLSLEIVSRRSDIPADISVKVMGSNDLGDSDPWVEVSTTDSVVDNGDGTWTHIFTQQTAVDSGGKQFLRLQVEKI